MLSQHLIEELQVILREECGVDFELNEVSQIGNGLVGYFDLLARIKHRDTIKENDILNP